MSRQLTIALAGNQNCGKTTLFNRLTGDSQHVGNWPGVTVEKKTGTLLADKRFQVIDLPGVYSLTPYSMEEQITRSCVACDGPDVVVNVVDATCLERCLYLTLQLMSCGRPMVVALNMMDEVRARGDLLHVERLRSALGVPVVPISARCGEGLAELVDAVRSVDDAPAPPSLGQQVMETLAFLARLVSPLAERAGMSSRYAAERLLEGDEPVRTALALPPEQSEAVERAARALEAQTGMERAAILADARYRLIGRLLSTALVRKSQNTLTRSERIDNVLAHPLLALPLFALALAAVFAIPFGPVGGYVSAAFEGSLDAGIALLDGALLRWGVDGMLRELVVSGALTGISSVLSFLPVILLLFLCLSVLEDSGYMARAAFLMDRPLRAIGLNGRSFIPLLMGFGCTVPAVMAARGMASGRDKRLTILLTPFMSCGAKAPVYAMLCRVFFPERAGLAMGAFYLLGVLMAALAGGLMKSTAFAGASEPFLMELPAYRLPTVRGVLRGVWDKAADFVRRAFTVIFLSTLAVWALTAFTPKLSPAPTASESILGTLGAWLSVLFRPLGFGTAPAVTAVLTGVLAKESVVSTLGVLLGGESDLSVALRQVFPTAASAVSFLTFVLLYTPCVAALSTIARETDGPRTALRCAFGQTAIAWAAAFVVYRAMNAPVAYVAVLASAAVLGAAVLGAIGRKNAKKSEKIR